MEPMNVNWYDAKTDEELTGKIHFDHMQICPRVGDEIHYWQDGTETKAGGDAVFRYDFIVRRIRHDLRYSPRGRGNTVHTLEIWVEDITK